MSLPLKVQLLQSLNDVLHRAFALVAVAHGVELVVEFDVEHAGVAQAGLNEATILQVHADTTVVLLQQIAATDVDVESIFEERLGEICLQRVVHAENLHILIATTR